MAAAWRTLAFASLVLCVCLSSFADDVRPAEAILADIERLPYPSPDKARAQDPGYAIQYQEERAKVDMKKNELILELYNSYPKHEKAVELMPVRWNMLIDNPSMSKKVEAEIDAAIKADPASTLAVEGLAIRTQSRVYKRIFIEKPADLAGALEAINEFAKLAPKDERAARWLGLLSDAHPEGSAERAAVNERLQKDYPKSSVARYAAGKQRQIDALGKPFVLKFQNAINGETVDMNNLRGQVVVIDFWATWCGPCVRDIPRMKDLYTQYHEKGVEFIGVSLDQPVEKGGLDALKAYVKSNQIPWPQYYQGHYWTSDFSSDWGINNIPAVFVVDKHGNLRHVRARGQLEQLIPQYLAE